MDEPTFDALFARHEPAVRDRLRAMVRDEPAVEDLLQEAFLRLWTKADQVRDPKALKNWLLRTATNLALNHLRTRRRQRSQPLEPEAGAEDEDREEQLPDWMVDGAAPLPDERLEQTETLAHLKGLMDALPAPQREVIRLVHEMELNIEETARRLGVAPGTVKSRLHYARLALDQGRQEWLGGHSAGPLGHGDPG